MDVLRITADRVTRAARERPLRTTDQFELDPTAEGTPSVLVFSGPSEARRS